MYAMLPLAKEQIQALREEHGIYMAGSGRINVAGLTTGNLPQFIAALAAVAQ
jgi:aromatic-amino-acid transaminase